MHAFDRIFAILTAIGRRLFGAATTVAQDKAAREETVPEFSARRASRDDRLPRPPSTSHPAVWPR
jgi:hypothetical protein